MLSRYKGPGSKSAIRACIMRKGKALGCKGAKGDSNKDDTKVIEELINSEAFDSSRELLVFLNYADSLRVPDDALLDTTKESACNLLDKLRAKRLGDSYTSQVSDYQGRSINSLMDALCDEIDTITLEADKK